MKFLVVLALLSCAIAGEVPSFPKGGLLVFPATSEREQGPTKTFTSTDYAKDNLESLNERVMERLRQEVGSERGIYHVYLPDGRLQRVQYTAAPLGQQQAKEKEVSSVRDSASERAANLAQGLDAGLNTYYVQVPEERLHALRASQSQSVEANYGFQQSRNANSDLTAPAADSRPLEVKAQFVPLQVITPEQLAQYRNQH